jgi:hypothetical protein
MPMDLKDIIAELEMDGESKEALSFDTVIKLISDEDEDVIETMTEMPSLPKLLRQVHKAGFWHGAEFGRQVFLEIMENEKKMEILKESDSIDF